VGEALAESLATQPSPSEGELTYICDGCGETIKPVLIPIINRWRRGTCTKCPPAWLAENAERESRQAAIQRDKLLGRYRSAFPMTDMGDRLLGASIDNFITRTGTEKAVARARQFLAGLPDVEPRGLLLWGSPGNGKSHLAAGIAHAGRERGMAVAWLHVPTWLRQLGTMENDDREYLLGLAARAELTVLDEIGGGKTTASRADWLLYVVDERYRHRRPLVATTNLDPDSLAAALDPASTEKDGVATQDGARIVDRLSEMCAIVENQASSYRKDAARRRIERQA
jgi:DNA replication protein DnaC